MFKAAANLDRSSGFIFIKCLGLQYFVILYRDNPVYWDNMEDVISSRSIW